MSPFGFRAELSGLDLGLTKCSSLTSIETLPLTKVVTIKVPWSFRVWVPLGLSTDSDPRILPRPPPKVEPLKGLL